MYDMAWQLPAPLHADPPVAVGHESSPQAVPVKYASHVHVPAVSSHTPRLEHCAVACAVFAPVASSNHAGEDAQDRREQSVPVYPLSHVHTNVDAPAHVPWPLQTTDESVDGHALTVPLAKPQSARQPAVFVTEPPAPFDDDQRLAVEPSKEAHAHTPVARLQMPRLEHSRFSRFPCTVAVVEPYEDDAPSATMASAGVPDDCVNDDSTFNDGKLPDWCVNVTRAEAPSASQTAEPPSTVTVTVIIVRSASSAAFTVAALAP